MENNLVHLRNIMMILKESDEVLSMDSLKSLVFEKFGGDVVFNNCSGKTFSYDEVISFMTEKGKIEIIDGNVILHGCNCSHK